MFVRRVHFVIFLSATFSQVLLKSEVYESNPYPAWNAEVQNDQIIFLWTPKDPVFLAYVNFVTWIYMI